MQLRNFDELHKPYRKCPYGFTCASHPWGKNKITKDCKYYNNCKRIVKKLIKVSDEQNRHEEYINKIAKKSKWYDDEASAYEDIERGTGTYQQSSWFLEAIEQHERSVIFLRERGNHQSPKSLGVSKQISQAQKLLQQLESKLKKFDRGYIAPEGVVMKTCNPKHDSANKEQQSKTYNCYKLQSTTAQFEPPEGKAKCKSIYLGKVDNEKYIQGKLGIERRKRLLKIRTQLTNAVKAIEEAAELADAEFDID